MSKTLSMIFPGTTKSVVDYITFDYLQKIEKFLFD